MKKINWKKLPQYMVVFLILAGFLDYIVHELYVPNRMGNQGFPLQRKWSTKLRGSAEEISIIDNDIVLARSAFSLNVLSLDDGTLLWKRIFNEETGSVGAYNSTIYVTLKGSLIAFDKEDGDVLWQQPLDDSRTSAKIVDLSEDVIVLNQISSNFSIHNRNTGELEWITYAGRGKTNAYILGNTLYTYSDYVKAYNLASGELLWKDEATRMMGANISEDGIVYFSQGGHELMAYDLENRIEVWKTTLDLAGPYGLATLIIKDDYLIIDDDTALYIVEKSSGVILQRQKMDQAANPQFIGNQMFVLAGFDQTIHSYEVGSWNKSGTLRISTPKLFYIDYKVMDSSEKSLVFSKGKTVFAYE